MEKKTVLVLGMVGMAAAIKNLEAAAKAATIEMQELAKNIEAAKGLPYIKEATELYNLQRANFTDEEWQQVLERVARVHGDTLPTTPEKIAKHIADGVANGYPLELQLDVCKIVLQLLK